MTSSLKGVSGDPQSQQYDSVDGRYVLPRRQEDCYPIDAFPDIIRQAVIDVDAELGGGLELGASAALGVVSVVCQEFVNVQRPKLRPASCSLFLITIADTGAGKSEIQGRFMTALEEFEREEEARAKGASGDYKDLPDRERLSQLRTLRAERQELLESYDDLHRRDEELRKKEGRPIISVRQRRDSTAPDRAEGVRVQRESKQQARIERQALKPSLKELEEHLAANDRTIRSVMGGTARRLVYGRGSFAGFRNGLQDKCRTAGIISAEAGGILNSPMVTRNMDAWNDLWGCEFYRETYDKRDYVIDAPRLTLALMVQPKQFEKFVDAYGENALDNGFLSRTLLLKIPSRSPKLAGGGDESGRKIASLDRFHRRVREILNQDFPWISERVVLKLPGKARHYWNGYYNELVTALEKGQFDPEMEGFVRKLPEQAARIAALFHYFENYPITKILDIDPSTGMTTLPNDGIPVETIRAAIRVCDWYMAEFRRLMVSHQLPEELTSWVYSTQVKANADRIYQTIQRNYRKFEAKQQSSCIRLTYRDIQNGNRTIGSRADILAALECLAYEGKVHRGRGPNGGAFVCFNHSHKYECGRCTNPMPVQGQSAVFYSARPAQLGATELSPPWSGQINAADSVVTESPDKSETLADAQHAKILGEGLLMSDDASPEASLLDLLKARSPGLFSDSGTTSANVGAADGDVAGADEALD